MTDDPFDKLENSKSSGGGGDYASWWDPSEGDKLIGILVEKHPYTDPGGDDHPVGTVRSVGRGALDEGEERATPTHSSLEGFIGDTEIGALVLIEYDGKVKANTGREMNAYQTSRLTEDEWRESDQEDHFQEVWEGSEHYRGGSGNEQSSDDDDSEPSTDGVPEKALDFAEDVLAMNDGEVSVQKLDDYLNDVRDYDVDVDAVIEESSSLQEDDGTVTEA